MSKKKSKKGNGKKSTNTKKSTNKSIKKIEVEPLEEVIEMPTKKVEEVKEVQEVENEGNKVVNFIIALVIIIVIGYFVYNSFIKINKPTDGDGNLTSTDIRRIGEEKYNWLVSQTNVFNHRPVFFGLNDIDYTTVSNQDILSIAYNQIQEDDKVRSGDSSSRCLLDVDVDGLNNYQDGCYTEIFDVKLLEEQVKKYFVDGMNVTYTDFVATGSKKCFISDNKYKCILKMSKFTVDKGYLVNALKKIETVDDKLYVYSVSFLVKRADDEVPGDDIGVYNDVLGTKKIDNINYYNEVTKGGLDKNSDKKLSDKYYDQLVKYKTTFILHDNEYIWDKTEVMK